MSINQVWPTKKQPIAQPTHGPHEDKWSGPWWRPRVSKALAYGCAWRAALVEDLSLPVMAVRSTLARFVRLTCRPDLWYQKKQRKRRWQLLIHGSNHKNITQFQNKTLFYLRKFHNNTFGKRALVETWSPDQQRLLYQTAQKWACLWTSFTIHTTIIRNIKQDD